jgi:hypothetical protein
MAPDRAPELGYSTARIGPVVRSGDAHCPFLPGFARPRAPKTLEKPNACAARVVRALSSINTAGFLGTGRV